MRVGILTFHHVLNYGALLQAYALQRKLEQLGHEASIINITAFQRGRHPLLGGYGLFSGNFMGRLRQKRADLRKHYRFKAFRKRHLKITQSYRSIDELQNSTERVDAIIVGSDQVWNDKYGSSAIQLYMLEQRSQPRPITLSYAASCGKPNQNKSLFEKTRFQAFDCISVRDAFTQKLVKECSDKESVVVVDPSLLIDWSAESLTSQVRGLPERYIFLYGFSKESLALAREMKRQLNCLVVGVPMEHDIDESGVDHVIRDAGVGEWLWLLQHSCYVCTKSFHGMMLSLMYQRPFMAAVGNSPGGARLMDAAEHFGIRDQVLPEISDEKISALLAHDTTEAAYLRVTRRAEDSVSFIEKAISSSARS